MARIAKILPLPVETRSGEMTMSNALAEKGFMRHPGTGIAFPPLKSPTGNGYLTGLDENAPYIDRILDSKERDAERTKVRERRQRLEKATGLDLSPTARYYSAVYDTERGKEDNSIASRVKLLDKENAFNFSNPLKEIEYWWVIQNTRLIAPSIEDWKAGRCKPTVQFYVSNPEEETAVIYKEKKASNKAINELEKMSLEKRKKVAKLLGLPVTDNDKEETVYNILDTFLRSGEVKTGEYKGQRSIQLFNDIVGLGDNSLNVKVLVKDALLLRVYTQRNGVIYEGDIMVAATADELIRELSTDAKQQERLALEIKVNDKKKMKQNIS